MPRNLRPRRRTARQATTKARRQDDQTLLPRCEGPRMHPYPHRDPKIQFEEPLCDYKNLDMSEGEGYVFKVRINDEEKPYVLKLFRFFDEQRRRGQLLEEDNAKISDAEFAPHMDPFYAECRAYGRIKEYYEDKLKKHDLDRIRQWTHEISYRITKRAIAARCYGYLYLSAEYERYLDEKCDFLLDWNRGDDDKGKPIRALVKEFVEERGTVDITRMRNDLRILQGIGVFPCDIVARNYRGGLLVDFGRSWTVPHCVMEALPRMIAETEIDWDLDAFDAMIEESNVRTSIRAARTNTRLKASKREEPEELLELADNSGMNTRPQRKSGK